MFKNAETLVDTVTSRKMIRDRDLMEAGRKYPKPCGRAFARVKGMMRVAISCA